MEAVLPVRIILEMPTIGVVFGVQKGKGTDYETIQKQEAMGENLSFELQVKVKAGKNTAPVFLGPFVHGTPIGRFIYIDIGKAAGQNDTYWSRRLKIPLNSITSDMMEQVLCDSTLVIETLVPGIGKDGGPNCGTVKPFKGWQLRKDR